MSEREETLSFLKDNIGAEGCGVSCGDAEVFKNDKFCAYYVKKRQKLTRFA